MLNDALIYDPFNDTKFSDNSSDDTTFDIIPYMAHCLRLSLTWQCLDIT